MKKMLKCKSRHKYFGLGRIVSTFGVFALVALVYAGLMSGTARGGTYKIDDVMQKLLEVETKIDTLSTASGGGTAEILAAIQATHMFNPLDVAVTVCTEIEGGAAIEGLANLGIGVSLEAHLGVDIYGSGAQIGIRPAGEIGAGLNIRSDVETYVTACINGIFARQVDDFTNSTDNELADLLASFDAGDTTSKAFVTELYDTGKRFRDRITTTAVNTNLVTIPTSETAYGPTDTANRDTTTWTPGSDRLNNSLNAFEAFSTLDLAGIANIIVHTGSGTPTALDDFAGSMPSFGFGNLFSGSNGLPSVVNLGSGDLTTIGNTISTGLTTLGLGATSSGSAGLGGLTSGLSGFDNLKTTLTTTIPTAINTVKDNVNTIKGQVNVVKNQVATLFCFLPITPACP